jgi:short-subunit dehydrogenase
MPIPENRADAHVAPMTNYKDKTIVVTGGSLGIGAEFASQLAARGANLVLVARDVKRLDAQAKELTAQHHVRVDTIAIDLTEAGAAQQVFNRVTALGHDVDMLINNAGFAKHGAFTEASLETQRGQVTLNVTALVELTYLFLPMLERRQGGIINVASTAAFQPVPFMAVYGATKAFVLSFSEALWGEYRNRGVKVLALCPGATDTPFFARAGEAAALGPKASAADVVRLGLNAYDNDRATIVHGFKNWALATSGRFVTREMLVKISRNLMKPKALLPA